MQSMLFLDGRQKEVGWPATYTSQAPGLSSYLHRPESCIHHRWPRSSIFSSALGLCSMAGSDTSTTPGLQACSYSSKLSDWKCCQPKRTRPMAPHATNPTHVTYVIAKAATFRVIYRNGTISTTKLTHDNTKRFLNNIKSIISAERLCKDNRNSTPVLAQSALHERNPQNFHNRPICTTQKKYRPIPNLYDAKHFFSPSRIPFIGRR